MYPPSNKYPFIRQATEDRLQIDLHGLACFEVNQQTIAIRQAAGVSLAEARRLQRGLPQAAHLLLRGAAPLHAAALRLATGAVLLAGPSAAGKSTLAAALHRRGYGLLADDITGLQLVDGRPVALPGYAGLILWPDAMTQLGIDPAACRRVHPDLEKYVVTSESPCTNAPLPVAAIFLLSVHNRPDIEIAPVTGSRKFEIVGHYSYNTRLTEALVNRDRFFALSAAIAATVPVWRVRRPRKIWTAESMASRLEALLP